ncbi:MAG: DUF2851 family protein [Bacteroidota bacterium]
MNEKLLHFIWKFSLFNQTVLFTTEGEKIEIIHPGTHNTNAGADFQNAKIRINKILWAGAIEIHVNSADWFQHHHQNDKAYDSVILHVVYQTQNNIAYRNNGELVPTIDLKSHISPLTLARYEELSKKKTGIPCEKFFSSVDGFTVKNFLDRLLIERLEKKVEDIHSMLLESENDWENVMFQMIGKYFGTGINKEPFHLLAKSLPVKIWAKHHTNPFQIEALVFGQAGFLEEKADDDYPNQLRKEYNYLKRLHNLQPLQKHFWKFLRLRPSNFPTIRLAQLAALMCKEVKLFSAIIESKNIKAIHELLDVEVSEYWKQHYVFDKQAKRVSSHIGSSMKNILIINAISPVLFAYGKYKADESFCDKAISLLETADAESNSVISMWKKYGQIPGNAYQSQALLQLKNEYCNNFRCLGCAVGTKILQ